MNERKFVVDAFVGIPRERIAVRGRLIKRIHRENWGTRAKSLYVILTTAGNVITLASSGKFTVGVEYNISGVVKSRKVFGGKNQTHLSDWTITKHLKKK